MKMWLCLDFRGISHSFCGGARCTQGLEDVLLPEFCSLCVVTKKHTQQNFEILLSTQLFSLCFFSLN